MTRRKSILFTSRLVDATYESFKAAFGRSILGLVFIKNRRNPSIYQSKHFNQAIVDQIIRHAHSKLQEQFGPDLLKYLKLQTSLDIDWDQTGRIIKIENFKIQVYSHLGELNLGKITFSQAMTRVQVDFFSSASDAAGPEVKRYLESIRREIGEDNILIVEHDFASTDGARKAKALGVHRIPAVVLNGKQPVMENPSKNALLDGINAILSPTIDSSETTFVFDSSRSIIQETLSATPSTKP